MQYHVWKARQPKVVAARENVVVRYDPTLGWTPRPKAKDKNLFGPGIRGRINRQGVRADREYSTAAPEGMKRYLCLGDSFMFGHGVGNNETFTAQLERLGGVEAINLGMMGYGLDRAYLRYLKEMDRYEHQGVILGLITDDFRRLLCDRGGGGYYKPRFFLKKGRLELANVPTPPRLAEGALIFPESRWQFVVNRYPGLRRLMPGRVLRRISYEWDDPRHSRPIAQAILKDLARRCRERRRELVIVWFPTWQERHLLEHQQLRQQHCQTLQDFARQHRIRVLDLMPAMESMAEAEMETLFLSEIYHHPSPQGQLFFAQKHGNIFRLWPPGSRYCRTASKACFCA